MRKKVLLQLESLGFRILPNSKISLKEIATGLFVNQNGKEFILFYPKPNAAPWPQWAAALGQYREQYLLIRLSDRRIIIQIEGQKDPKQFLLELTNLVRVSSSTMIFTPEFGFSQANEQNARKGFLAPAISLAIALGVLLIFGLENYPTDNPKAEAVQRPTQKQKCLADLPKFEMQKEAIELLSEMQLPAFSEGSLNLETDFGILEISPEQSIGGMTLLSVNISCFESDSTKQIKIRADVKSKGNLRPVESN